jgi:aryl-alcohol dehydrogenase-like predicted oxidoreductase
MLQHRQLGKTGLYVSPIGLGTVKLGRNTAVKYPTAFTIPDDQEASKLLSLAKELNINLLDTAPAYGNSEERLGKLLVGQRASWIIVTKAGEEFKDGKSIFNFSSEQIISSIHSSLQRLNTDYLDIVLVHSDGNDLDNINHYKVFETLAKLKTKGIIRAFGMSTKTISGGEKTIEQADLAMVTYNPVQQEEQPVLDLANTLQKGILVKKALASGHVNTIPGVDPIKASMEFIYSHPAVTSIIIGTISTKHLRQNVLTACKVLA